MRKALLVLLVAAVVIFGGTYVVYALDYQGNYNVTASFLAQTDTADEFSASGFALSSEPTGVVDCWDVLKGHGGGPSDPPPLDTIYYVYIQFEQDGVVKSGAVVFFNISADSSKEFSSLVKNVEPGLFDVRIYIKYQLTDQIVFDYTWTDKTVGA